MIRRLFFCFTALMLLLTACSDNDSFSSNGSYRLTFSEDTIFLDTLFSTVPSSTYTFWIHNHNASGVRISSVRLERGNQSGFRANVDGTYLDPVAMDLEVREGDSIRVFVEATTYENGQTTPQLVEDHLLFTLESGVVQRLNLRTWSWDAEKITDLVVTKDSTIESTKPMVFYGKGIIVNENATLTIRNTTLYFHDGAGIEVHGKLVTDNTLLRGDRLDYMFDYLPYDRVSGQWGGIKVVSNAAGVELTDSEIHSGHNALMCDSTTVILSNTIIHNCKGYGLYAHDSEVAISNSLIDNTLLDCLCLKGCQAVIDGTTLAQFYPLSANRGAALRFEVTEKPMALTCSNTLVTGYDEDVVFSEGNDAETMQYLFTNCLLRTPAIDGSEAFIDVIWETSKDEVQGKAHFVTFDDYHFIYDFHVKDTSPIYGKSIGWQSVAATSEGT